MSTLSPCDTGPSATNNCLEVGYGAAKVSTSLFFLCKLSICTKLPEDFKPIAEILASSLSTYLLANINILPLAL